LASSVPQDPYEKDHLEDLPQTAPGETKALGSLAERLLKLANNPVKLQIRRAGASKDEIVEIPPGGFEFDDAFIGTSDDLAKDPFEIKEIPLDPRDPEQ